MCCRTTSAMDFPLCRTEATSVKKSCTPPMKIEPRMIQIHAGSHPNNVAAKIGPTIGPAAAIAEKCCGNNQLQRAGS